MSGAKGRRNYVFKNWSKCDVCKPQLYFEPRTVKELEEIVLSARTNKKRIRVVGNGHSMAVTPIASPANGDQTGLCCTSDYLVSMKHFCKLLQVWPENHQVKVGAGILIEDLNRELQRHNLAMSVLPVLVDASLGGILSTGVHGSGRDSHIVAHYVVELEMMLASGEVVVLSRERDEERFLAACVSLGSMGIIISVILQCTTAFNLQVTDRPAKLQDVLKNLDAHLNASDHFQFGWYIHTDHVSLRNISRTSQPANPRRSSWFWDMLIGCHLVALLFYIGSFFPSIVRYMSKAHFKLFTSKEETFTESSFQVFRIDYPNCFVLEYAIPRKNTESALLEMREWVEKTKYDAHFTVLARFIKKDDIYLSGSYGVDTAYINICTFWPFGKLYDQFKFWEAFEKIMQKAGGRPHWGKGHTLTGADLKPMYPMWEKFHNIRHQLDPTGMFMNEHLERIFG